VLSPEATAEVEREYFRAFFEVSNHMSPRDLRDMAAPPAAFDVPTHARIAEYIASAIDARGEVGMADAMIALWRSGDSGAHEALQDATNVLPKTTLPRALESLQAAAQARQQRTLLLRAASDAASGKAIDSEAIADSLSRAIAAPAKDTSKTEHEVARIGMKRFADLLNGDASKSQRLGIPALDDVLGGADPGSLTVIGGRTSAGKSTLALCFASSMADCGARVGIVSCEDPPETWGNRILSSRVRVSAQALRTGQVQRHEMDGVMSAVARADTMLGDALSIDFAVGAQLDEVCQRVERLVTRRGAQAVFVDYVQAISMPKAQDRRNEIREIAAKLKATAARLEVPLFLLSQLRRHEGEPSLSDLKESSDLEEKAEAVLLLWYDENARGRRLRVAKNKNGPSNSTFVAHWDRHAACFIGFAAEAE